MSDTVLEVNEPNCVAEEFEGEIVALNLATGNYFSIRDNSAAVWRDLCAGHSIEALMASAGANPPMAAAIETFASQAIKEGLLRSADVAPKSLAPPVFSSDGPLPELEIYQDMQNLLLLDPVHDVDEQHGWPKVKGT